MHILFVPSWYPAHPDDVSGSFFREQALALRKHGMHVGVIAPALRSLSSGPAALAPPFGLKEELDAGIPTLRYHGVRAFSWNHALNMRFWERIGLETFNHYCARHGRPDLLHVQATIFGLSWAAAIHRRYAIPFVVTEHSSEFALGNVRPQLRQYLSTEIRAASRCLAVSTALCDRLSSLLPPGAGRRWEVMPNLVSARFAQAAAHHRQDPEGFTFLNVAGLHRNKGHHHLLAAVAIARRAGTPVLLRIAGDGPEAQALKRQAEELGISNCVRFLGSCSRERVAEELAQCDAFVLSSSYETFGVAVVEALMSGKPVVVTRCGGPQDIVVPGQDGLIVGKDDPQALASGMLTLIAQRESFDGGAIRRRCIDRFAEPAFARRHAEVYQAVLSCPALPIRP